MPDDVTSPENRALLERVYGSVLKEMGVGEDMIATPQQGKLIAMLALFLLRNMILGSQNCPCSDIASYLGLIADMAEVRGLIVRWRIEHLEGAPEGATKH
jgi:hypothetical protein